jgi:hypothetical protein
LLPQLKPAPHSASLRHTCTEPAAQLSAHLEVVPLLPAPPPIAPPAAGALGVRQHTSLPAQLAALEHELMVTVPMGHASALA